MNIGTFQDECFFERLASNPFYEQHGPYPLTVEAYPRLPKRRRDVWQHDKTIFDTYLPQVRSHEAGEVWLNALRHHYLQRKPEYVIGALLKRLYVDGVVLPAVAEAVRAELAAEKLAEKQASSLLVSLQRLMFGEKTTGVLP